MCVVTRHSDPHQALIHLQSNTTRIALHSVHKILFRALGLGLQKTALKRSGNGSSCFHNGNSLLFLFLPTVANTMAPILYLDYSQNYGPLVGMNYMTAPKKLGVPKCLILGTTHLLPHPTEESSFFSQPSMA